VSGIFNCGTGLARTWKDLVSAVFRAMGREPNIQFIDMPEHLRGKYQYHTQADLTKLRAAGYDRPFTSLEDGITDYVQNFLMKEE
jgi:ADP-L-glycero-D-manno-heptose 6-epimerase